MRQAVWFCFLLPSLISAQDGTVEGTVVNGITGSPLASVGVLVFTRNGPHYETETDTSGHFHIADISPGAYSARFDKEGFAPLELYANDSFLVGPGKQPPPAAVKLVPFARLRGRVYTPEGASVANAEMELGRSSTRC